MISIVIVTYNSQRSIQSCLESIYDQHCQDIEIVVVDNASTDQTKSLVRQYGQVRLIENSSNEGASKARNQGINATSGAWVLTLDSDVVLDKTFFQRFQKQVSGFPDSVGMIQPNILNSDGTRVYSHGIYLTGIRRFLDLDQGKSCRYVSRRIGQIMGPCSASAWYRRKMLVDICDAHGYFDERFFFLVEDVDLAWRAHRRGWGVVFDPAMISFHRGNGSCTNAALRQFLCFRNRHWMIAKNETPRGCVRVYAQGCFYELLRWLYMMAVNRYFRRQ